MSKSRSRTKEDSLAKKLLPEFENHPPSSEEVEEIYRIDGTQLPEIIAKIEADDSGPNMFLRQKGIQIRGKYIYKQGATIGGTAGMLVLGAYLSHKLLKRSETGLYLITFKSNDAEVQGSGKIKPNLVDLLREYII